MRGMRVVTPTSRKIATSRTRVVVRFRCGTPRGTRRSLPVLNELVTRHERISMWSSPARSRANSRGLSPRRRTGGHRGLVSFAAYVSTIVAPRDCRSRRLRNERRRAGFVKIYFPSPSLSACREAVPRKECAARERSRARASTLERLWRSFEISGLSN